MGEIEANHAKVWKKRQGNIAKARRRCMREYSVGRTVCPTTLTQYNTDPADTTNRVKVDETGDNLLNSLASEHVFSVGLQ
jgi:hypothetical protein